MRLFVFLNKWDSLILSGFKDKMAGHQNSLQIKQKCLKKQRVFIKPIIFIQRIFQFKKKSFNDLSVCF